MVRLRLEAAQDMRGTTHRGTQFPFGQWRAWGRLRSPMVPFFVGRQRELTWLKDALVSARAGEGGAVLVSGQAGIGKTSLAQELARTAAWLGTPAVWGPAVEGDVTPPYWPWRQLLGALARSAEGAEVPDFEQLDSVTGQFVFFERVVAVMRTAADPGGLLVVLDDLHWADIGSLRLLQVAAAQVPGSRVLIVGTYREPAPADDSALAQVLPALLRERAVTRIDLRGLDARDADLLLTKALDHPVRASVVQRLLEQTDGNPFYLVELAEDMRAAGQPARLPHSLNEMARRRLALVGERCRSTLGFAAVFGREFELRLLATATGEAPSDLLDRIAEGTSVGLIEELGPGQFRFAHALLREALYLDLSTAVRAAAHARVAAAIASLTPPQRAARIEALAHHLRHALPLGNSIDALAATIEAAESAEAQLAFEQAADRYRDALALVEREGATGIDRSELLLRQARCSNRAGDVTSAWQATELAAVAARDEGNVRALAAAALVIRGPIDPGIASPLHSLCQEALEKLRGLDALLEARLLAQLALAAGWLGDAGGEPGLADRALDAAERTADPDALFLALFAKERAIAGAPDQAGARLRLSEHAVKVASASSDPSLAIWAHSWRLGASWELGLRAQADSELGALAAAVDRIREPLAVWRLEMARATLAQIDGRYGDVFKASEKAFMIARRGGHQGASEGARIMHYLAAARTGDIDVEEELRSLIPTGTRLWYASYLADQGRFAEVREIWTAGASGVPVIPRELWLIGMVSMAKVAVALGDRDWAARLYEQMAPFPDVHVVMGTVGGYEGPAAFYIGRLAALLGRDEAAESHFGHALAGAERIGSPPYVALIRCELARLHAHRGSHRDRASAVALFERAGATAETLGMRPLAAAVAAELRLLMHPRGRPTLLSNRELEVAGLVVEGLTNRVIGERFHISERTAENHVKNIMDKLGIDSRAQIAAWYTVQITKLST